MVVKGFLLNEAAIFIQELRALCIADLHLGLEHELYRMGIVIPPQARKFKATIGRLLRLSKARVLIILGDVKHRVAGVSFRELKFVPELLKELRKEVDLHIALGNHDSGLKDILPEGIEVHHSSGFELEGYGFFHGHAWPSKRVLRCRKLFMGHVHPAMEFRDRFGYRIVERVWVESSLVRELVKARYGIKPRDKLTILPAFNPLVGGIPLNRRMDERLIGPLLRNEFVKLDDMQAYLLDGTPLGRIN